MHSALEIVASVDRLKSLPAVYHRIRAELESPEGSLNEVARLVTHDGVITGRILQVVNSPLYGFSGQIDSVMRAVQLLGMQQVHDLVLATAVSEAFDGVHAERMNMRMFWRLSVLRGLAARVIARHCSLLDAERMFVIGLLADMGHLVMYLTVPELAERAQNEADATEQPLHTIERRLIGADYAEVGCALLDSWQLPLGFASAVGGQHTPCTAGAHNFEAAILSLANRVADADRRGLSSEDAATRVDSAIWTHLDLAPNLMGEIREEAELNLAAVTALFFSRH
ncbi:HDOD domain-containing protein [Denitromonas ohlonensis]|uniref:HDOD domain-containing protein n=2 Tax=Denitromonas TaxID=139331 RepID=A0A557RW27_9RHOO|nr:HDOD domain-containing protein [Denitromonas ohlonensis]TVO69344.1 HDOD domain-containing protein [Denitromonas ohlonensis]TVO77444.1 HDOD domain-containing protein [Denitromonas ohlonensis]